MIDLHLHTTASDGYLSPTALIQLLENYQITVCAVTDHDTNEGVQEAIDAAKQKKIECISGIELSCTIREESVHLLGYFREANPEPLTSFVKDEIQKWRAERNPKMIEKLQQLGYSITMDLVKSEANGGQVGRPHFARALVKLGAVKSINDAFDTLLADGKPAYVDKIRLPLKEGVSLIHSSGGAAVLAHPMVYPFVRSYGLKKLIRTAKESNVDGIEAYYSDHTVSQRRKLERYAIELDLLITGGSDFHGPVNGSLQPGKGHGNLSIPDVLVGPLLYRIEYWYRQKQIHQFTDSNRE